MLLSGVARKSCTLLTSHPRASYWGQLWSTYGDPSSLSTLKTKTPSFTLRYGSPYRGPSESRCGRVCTGGGDCHCVTSLSLLRIPIVWDTRRKYYSSSHSHPSTMSIFDFNIIAIKNRIRSLFLNKGSHKLVAICIDGSEARTFKTLV